MAKIKSTKKNIFMEKFRTLKLFTSTMFDNKQKYLFYDYNTDTWYFITTLSGKDLKMDLSDCVVSKVRFKTTLFLDIFKEYYEEMLNVFKVSNNYVLNLSRFNKLINDTLKNQKIDIKDLMLNINFNISNIDSDEDVDDEVTIDLDSDEESSDKNTNLFSYFNFNIKELIESVIDSVTNLDSYFVKDLIDIQYTLNSSDVTLVDLKKLDVDSGSSCMDDIKLRLHFLNGYNCVSKRFLKNTTPSIFNTTVYTSTHRVYRYIITYEDNDVSVITYQPFALFAIP